jgi:glutamate dehydrogenase
LLGAREALHKATGIPIVKDSSANKCGVICSSFEIMSSMLLSEKVRPKQLTESCTFMT